MLCIPLGILGLLIFEQPVFAYQALASPTPDFDGNIFYTVSDWIPVSVFH